ncbi:hypothetical protein ABT112_16730 [Streptomyces sp. NPDC002055]|uniref:hypothetical protein n=1 Tax=Streptomyces sp. NPDC002055 TaxID=3154534 RepID=UPI003320B2A2
MDAVLETYDARGFALWPVAEPRPAPWLPLSGALSPSEVGTALAVLTTYNRGGRRSDGTPRNVLEQVRRLTDAECVIAPGGLRVRHTGTGITAQPGCCFGLENWRDWLELVDRGEPWLGHDPTPVVEHSGETARLWSDGDRRDTPPIDIPRALLPGLLGSVHDGLVGFLASVGQWADRRVPSLADDLVAKLDEGLAITAPLPHPGAAA